jgi:hypothetical protein
MSARTILACGMIAASVACETSEPVPDEARAATPEEAEPDDPEPADARARAIQEAEAFVRAQGYTDTPPTATGDELVREGIEGTIEDRLHMLDPRAVRATGANGEWNVVFRYRDPELAGRGRMLRLRPGARPSFVHQDLVLPELPAGD